jgi:hypothetical protein
LKPNAKKAYDKKPDDPTKRHVFTANLSSIIMK